MAKPETFCLGGKGGQDSGARIVPKLPFFGQNQAVTASKGSRPEGHAARYLPPGQGTAGEVGVRMNQCGTNALAAKACGHRALAPSRAHSPAARRPGPDTAAPEQTGARGRGRDWAPGSTCDRSVCVAVGGGVTQEECVEGGDTTGVCVT